MLSSSRGLRKEGEVTQRLDRYSRLSLPSNERDNPCGTLTKASGTCPKPKRLPSSLSARIIRLNDARKQSFLLLLVYSTLPQPNTTTNPKLHLSGAPTLICCTMRTSVPAARRPPACDALDMRVSTKCEQLFVSPPFHQTEHLMGAIVPFTRKGGGS